jgi:AraC-like DNA-binding protein
VDYTDYSALQGELPLRVYSEHPLPPMLRLHRLAYPPRVEYDYHTNRFSSACLVLRGAMAFQERGSLEFTCRAGGLALLPVGSEYRWRIDEATDTFQCLHDGFSAYEHGELAILLGPGQRRLASVALGKKRADAFLRRLGALRRREASEIRYSIATLELFADAVARLGEPRAGEGGEECAPVIQCVYYIERNVDREITVPELARQVHVSASRLFQLFQRSFGLSPMQYVARRRTEAAKRLLTSSTLSAGEIAGRLGFQSANYFIRFFRKHAGCTPMALRRRERVRVWGHL